MSRTQCIRATEGTEVHETCQHYQSIMFRAYAQRNWQVRDLAMGWLQLVGSFKLQVSFAKEPYQRDDILQKRRII